MLLSLALFNAQRENVKKINLKTTDEGVFIYAAFGFKPICRYGLPSEIWEKLSYPKKVKILATYQQKFEPNLVLNLQEPYAQMILQSRLEKALTLEQQEEKVKRPLINLQNMEVPEEAYQWDILPAEDENERRWYL